MKIYNLVLTGVVCLSLLSCNQVNNDRSGDRDRPNSNTSQVENADSKDETKEDSSSKLKKKTAKSNDNDQVENEELPSKKTNKKNPSSKGQNIASNTGTICTNQGGNVNIRSGPSKNTAVITSISSGSSVSLIGSEDGDDGFIWYRIPTNNGEGYIRKDFVCTGQQQTTQTKKPPTSSNLGNSAIICTDKGGNVNLRSGPTQNSSVITSLKSGSSVSVVNTQSGNDGFTWYQVSSNGQSGYIRQDFVCTGNRQVNNQNQSQTQVSEDIKSGAIICTNKGGNVNLRSGPTQDSSVVTSLRSGSSISIVDESPSGDGFIWYRVSTGGRSGYIRSDFVCTP